MNSDNIVSRSSWRQWVAALGVSSIMAHTGLLEELTVYSCEDLSTVVTESSLHVGLTIFGAFLGAILADAFGRKMSLLGAIIFVIPRVLGIVLEESPVVSRVLQVFAKIGFGTTSTLVPLYIAEIADTKNRKYLMTLQTPIKCLSCVVPMAAIIIFRASILGMASMISNGILLAISVVFYFITIVLFPESPDYLYSKKKYSEATKSLGFLRGISNMTIGEENTELSNLTVQVNVNRHAFFRKISEMFELVNRRNLAIIVSLIAIKWASGHVRNTAIFTDLAFMIFDDYMFGVFYGICVLHLILSIFVTLGINLFSRKLFVLLILFVNLIAAIIGTLSYMQYKWVFFGVFLIHNVGYLIINSITLAYMGEFFPANIRAVAFATVMSCEFLIHGIVLTNEICLLGEHNGLANTTLISSSNAVVYFFALLFVLIFFPKINKIPCSRITMQHLQANCKSGHTGHKILED